jgi:hypothetical protein
MGNIRGAVSSAGLLAVVFVLFVACAAPAAGPGPAPSGTAPIATASGGAVTYTGSGGVRGSAPATTGGVAPRPLTSSNASATPRCPAKLSLTSNGIPKPPSTITAHRMLPDGTVRSALMCVYVGTNMDPDAGLPLLRRMNLGGDLAAMAEELRWLPPEVPGEQHSCSAVGGTQTNFLVAVGFADGRTSWLGAADDPNACIGTAGSIISSGTTGARFLAAMRAGRWVPPTKPDGGSCSGQARFGQQVQMVPAGAVSVRICLDIGSSSSHVDRTTGFTGLVNALDQPPTRASTSSCAFPPTPPGTKVPDNPFYRLVFHYRQGPSVGVRVMLGCVPAIDNSSLQAADSSGVATLIKALMSHP